MFVNVEIKFFKLFIVFIFLLFCSCDDDQLEMFKVFGNFDYECKLKCKDVYLNVEYYFFDIFVFKYFIIMNLQL